MTSPAFKQFCEAILDEGLEIFEQSLGIVSKISDSTYLIIAVKPDADVFKSGDTFPLQDTYCRDVYKHGYTVAITQIDETPGLIKHPLYANLPLESYRSSPIMINEQVWGTLNYSSMKICDRDFNNEEIDLIEGRAQQIADYIQENAIE